MGKEKVEGHLEAFCIPMVELVFGNVKS